MVTIMAAVFLLPVQDQSSNSTYARSKSGAKPRGREIGRGLNHLPIFLQAHLYAICTKAIRDYWVSPPHALSHLVISLY